VHYYALSSLFGFRSGGKEEETPVLAVPAFSSLFDAPPARVVRRLEWAVPLPHTVLPGLFSYRVEIALSVRY
jgi:hypothetical protein